MEPLRLPVTVSNAALEVINKLENSPTDRLYKFLGETNLLQDGVIGRDGMKAIVDAVYDGRKIINFETDKEFLARIAFRPANEDDIRLYKLAKKYVELGKR